MTVPSPAVEARPQSVACARRRLGFLPVPSWLPLLGSDHREASHEQPPAEGPSEAQQVSEGRPLHGQQKPAQALDGNVPHGLPKPHGNFATVKRCDPPPADASATPFADEDRPRLRLGCYEAQGTRSHNEDRAFSVIYDDVSACFGVLDGHGGQECSHHLQERIPEVMECCRLSLHKEPCDNKRAEQVKTMVHDLEDELRQRWEEEWCQGERDPGTTLTVATVIRDMMVVATVGDSRLIIVHEAVDAQGSKCTRVEHCTEDHNCRTNEKERRRVLEKGGKIADDGCLGREVVIGADGMCEDHSSTGASRDGSCEGGAPDSSDGLFSRPSQRTFIDPVIEVSRSLGDFSKKEELSKAVLSPTPEVSTFRITSATLFAVAFTDGISSCMTDQEVCDKVTELLNTKTGYCNPEYAARELTRWAVDVKRSSDNCSATVALFRDTPPPMQASRRPRFQFTKSSQALSSLASPCAQQQQPTEA